MKNINYNMNLAWDIIEKELNEKELQKWLKAFQRIMKFKEPLTLEEAYDEVCFGCRDTEALQALIKVRPEDERPVMILAEEFGIVKGVPKNININEVEWKLQKLIRDLFLRKADEEMRREYRRGEFEKVQIELEHLETVSVDQFGEIQHNNVWVTKKDIYFLYKKLRKSKPLYVKGYYKRPLV